MTENVTFRYAQRKDVPLIMEFVKALAEYEKMPELVCATEELIEEWMFDKERAEVLFLMVLGKEAGFALFFESFASYPGKGGMRIEWLCLKSNLPSIGFYESVGGKQMEMSTTFRLENEALEKLAEE